MSESQGRPTRSGPRRPLRLRWWLLVVALVVVPLAEIYVLIQVGQVIGVWWTILLLIADSIFGSWLIKREGGRAWSALREALESGRMPARELADGALILVGGTLMLSPGFVTDAFGILLILPFTRPIARRILTGVVARRLTVAGVPGGFGGMDGMRPPSPGSPGGKRPGGDSSGGGPDVVPGRVVD